MISGVNFDPSQQEGNPTRKKPGEESGVQEAIKVLSLRLPRVVGAQAMAPSALLNSQGSGGHVDGVVSQIMSQLFGSSHPPTAPMIPPASYTPEPPTMGPGPGESGTMPVRVPGVQPGPGPSFTGVAPSPNTPLTNLMPPGWPTGGPPRIIMEGGAFAGGGDGVSAPTNTAPPPLPPVENSAPASDWSAMGAQAGGGAAAPQPGTDVPSAPMESLMEFLLRRQAAPPPR